MGFRAAKLGFSIEDLHSSAESLDDGVQQGMVGHLGRLGQYAVTGNTRAYRISDFWRCGQVEENSMALQMLRPLDLEAPSKPRVRAGSRDYLWGGRQVARLGKRPAAVMSPWAWGV